MSTIARDSGAGAYSKCHGISPASRSRVRRIGRWTASRAASAGRSAAWTRRTGTSPGRATPSPTVSFTTTRYLIASLVVRMPPAGLTPTWRPYSACISRTASSMSSVTGSVAAGRDLAGRRLDEVAAGQHADPGGAPDVVVRGQLAGLQDHLEMRVTAGPLHRDDLVEHVEVSPGQKRAPVDHHVDLVRTGVDRGLGVGELHRRAVPGRTGTRSRRSPRGLRCP